MSEIDCLMWGIGLVGIPLIGGYLLRSKFKFNLSTIFLMTVLLFIFGYFLNIKFYLIGFGLFFGGIIEELLEEDCKEEKKKKTQTPHKWDVDYTTGEKIR